MLSADTLNIYKFCRVTWNMSFPLFLKIKMPNWLWISSRNIIKLKIWRQ